MKNITKLFVSMVICLSVSFMSCGGGGGGGTTTGPVDANNLDGATDVPVGSSFKYTFASLVTTASVTNSTFFLHATSATATTSVKRAYDDTVCDVDSAVAASITCGSSLDCTLDPSSDLNYNTNYTLCLTPDITHISGGAFDGFLAQFTTETGDAPTITGVTPADHTTMLKTASIVVTFSKSMDTDSLLLEGTMGSESDGGAWSTTTNTNDTLTISPSTSWSLGTRTLTIACTDLAGNELATASVSANKDASTGSLAYGVQTIYVSSGGSGDGTWGSPIGGINDGITSANSMLTAGTWDAAHVEVSQGTYSGDSSATPATHVQLVEGISLYGGFSTTDWAVRDTSTYTTTVEDTASSGGDSTDPNSTVEADSGITTATVVDGFTINGGSGNWSSAVWNHDGGAPTISNNTIDGGSGDSSTGVLSRINSSPIIHGNTIDGGSNDANDTHGVFNDVGCDSTIYNNTITVTAGVYIYVLHDIESSSTTYGNTIIANAANTGDSDGVKCEDCASTFYNNIIGGGETSNFGWSIGMHITGSDTPSVYNNIIFAGSETAGVDAYAVAFGDSGSSFDNNILYTTGGSPAYCGYQDASDDDPTSFKNNNLYDCGDALYYDGSSDLTTIGAVNGQSFASGNITEDLSGCLDSDYRFAGCSLDSYTFDTIGLDGSALGWGFTTDKDGTTRVGNGSTGWSVGPYEYD